MRVKYMTPLCSDGETDLGFIFRGPLILYDDPRTPREAATKRYVDNKLGNLDAGVLTGGVISVDTLPAFSGDVVMDAGSEVVELTPTGVIAGSYTKATVDAKGRIVYATSLSQSDIPQLDWSKIVKNKPTTLEGYGIQDGLSISGGSVGPGFGVESLPQDDLHLINRAYFNQRLEELNILPVGSIVEFPTINGPDGYLKANGALVSKTTYPELYSVIGNKFSKLRMQLGYGRPWEQQYDSSGDTTPPQLEELGSINTYTYNKYGEATVFSTNEHMYLIGNSVRPDIGTVQAIKSTSPSNYDDFIDLAIYEGDGTTDNIREVVMKPLPTDTPFIHISGKSTDSLYLRNELSMRSVARGHNILTLLIFGHEGGNVTLPLPTTYESWVTGKSGFEQYEGRITSMSIDLRGSSINIGDVTLSRGDNFNQTFNVTWTNLGVLFIHPDTGEVNGIGHGSVSASGTIKLNGFVNSTTDEVSYTVSLNRFYSQHSSASYVLSNPYVRNYTISTSRDTLSSPISATARIVKGDGNYSKNFPKPPHGETRATPIIETVLLPSKNSGKSYGISGAEAATIIYANPATPPLTKSFWEHGGNSVFTFPVVTSAKSSGSYLTHPVLNSEALLIKDKAYLFGGEISGIPVNNVQYSDSRTDGYNKGYRFSKWKGVGTLPQAMSKGTVFYTGSKIYYLGGKTLNSISNKIYSVTLNQNGSLGTWTQEGLLPVPIYGHSVCILDSVIYLIGGVTPNGDNRIVYKSEINPTGTIVGFQPYLTLTSAPGESTVFVTDRGFLLLGTEYEIRGNFDERKNLAIDSYRQSNIPVGSSRRISSYKGRLMVVDSAFDETVFKRYGGYVTKNFGRSWYDDSYSLNISNQDGFYLPDFESTEVTNDYYIKY